MRKIKKPEFGVKDVFSDCITIVENEELKIKLQGIIPNLISAEQDFEEKIKCNEIHQVNVNKHIGHVNADEMKSVYNSRFVRKETPGRKYYDQLLAAAPNGKCPLCNQRIASTLDHYLPKMKFPIYAVTPINLIPSCFECNKGKLQEVPTTKEEATLHPYFDDIEDFTWLKLRIIRLNPIGFEYYIFPPTEWDEILKDRLQNHFDNFKLNELYSIHAYEELSNISYTLQALLANGGNEAVRLYLVDAYESRKRINNNSWQTALYRELSINEWFYGGGFEN